LALKRAVTQMRLSPQQQRGFWHAVHTEIEQDYATEVKNLSLWHWDEVEEHGGKHLVLPGGYDRRQNNSQGTWISGSATSFLVSKMAGEQFG